MIFTQRIEVCTWWTSGSAALLTIPSFGGLLVLQQQGLRSCTQRADVSAWTICSSMVPYPCVHDEISSAYVHCDLQHVLASQPSIATLASILRHCGISKALPVGMLVHDHMKRQGLDQNIFLSNCLVLMYAQCENMESAQQVFNRIPQPNSYSWSILIKGYALNDKLDEARHVLAQIPNPDTVAYNTMITAYAQKQQGRKALDLFWKMQVNGMEPDTVTLTCTLDACSSFTALEEAQDLLAYINNSKFAEENSVKTAIITLLSKFGRLDDAWEIFSNLLHQDVVSWNAMIAAHAQNGHSKKSLDLYFQMHLQGMVASSVTLGHALDACTSLLDLEEGQRIHNFMILYGYDEGLFLGISLIHMYGKCGCLSEARDSFNRIASHNVISWTALMTACVDGNVDEEALNVFFCMQYHGFDPNEVTLTCALGVCASLAALEAGFSIHAAAVCNAHDVDQLVGTALVHMYGKCGLVNDARSVFNKMRQKDVAVWNAMLTVYAQSGHGKQTLQHFDEMLVAGFRPNTVTFTCVLTACSHMGWVDDGRKYLLSLHQEYGLPSTAEHWSCMIDLLGRAGCLEEVKALLCCVAIRNLAPLLTSLLAACKNHGDLHWDFCVADQFSEADLRDPGPFVMLANLFATRTDFDE